MNAACQQQAPLSELPIEILPQITISEKEYLSLKCELGYWRSMHEKALSRIDKLNRIIAHQKGIIRDLTNRLFGKKGEKKGSKKKDGEPKNTTPEERERGQQPGSEGHGRTERPDLPRVEEPVDFSEIPKCSECGTAYLFDGKKESEIIEVEVKAYTRVIKRSCMKKGCTCKGVPATVTAPMPPKVLPNTLRDINLGKCFVEQISLQPANQSSAGAVQRDGVTYLCRDDCRGNSTIEKIVRACLC